MGMVVREQPLGHRHGKEGDARLLHEGAHLFVGLSVSCSLAEDDEGFLGRGEEFQGTLHRARAGVLLGSRVYGHEERVGSRLSIHGGAKHGRGNIEVHATGTARHGGAYSTCHAHSNIFGAIDAIGSLGKGLGHVHLVEPLIVALREVDNVAVARAANLYHGEAIGGGCRQGGEAIKKAWGRHGEADAWLTGEIATDSSGITCRLLVAEPDVADAHLLSMAGEVGDGDTHDTIDSVHTITFEGIDHEVHAVGKGGVGVVGDIVHKDKRGLP